MYYFCNENILQNFFMNFLYTDICKNILPDLAFFEKYL